MQGTIAPVDLAQAAIGPGISIYSRFGAVREPDGTSMPVKEALSLISLSLGEVLNEQESAFDPVTRFAVTWYKQFGWDEESSGTAELLALSSDTSISELQRNAVLLTSGGKAKLSFSGLEELGLTYSHGKDLTPNIWFTTIRAALGLDKSGFDECASILREASRDISLDAVKELGFLLFHEAEKNSRTKDALLFNGLVSAWSELSLAANTPERNSVQTEIDFDTRYQGSEE
jgi:putative DNA methylase